MYVCMFVVSIHAPVYGEVDVFVAEVISNEQASDASFRTEAPQANDLRIDAEMRFVLVFVHTYIHTCIHINIQRYVHTYIHTYIHINVKHILHICTLLYSRHIYL